MGIVFLNIPIYAFSVHNFLTPNIWYLVLIICIALYSILMSGYRSKLLLPSMALVLFLGVYIIYSIVDPSLEIFSTIFLYTVAWMITLLYLNYSSNINIFKYLLLILSSLIFFDFFYSGVLYNYELAGSVFGRGSGTHINSNQAGEVLLILLVLASAKDKDIFKSWTLIIFFAAIVLTFSRSAILFSILMGFFIYVKNLKYFLFFIISLLIIYFTYLNILNSVLLPEAVTENLIGRLDFFTNLNIEDYSSSSRIDVVNNSFDHFLLSPMFGNGMNYTHSPLFGSVRPHNTLLLLIVEYGVIGLTMYIYLVALLLRGAFIKNTVNGFMPISMFIFFSMFNHDILFQLHWLIFLILSVSYLRTPISGQSNF